MHSLLSPWKRKGKKEKFLQHRVFVFGHPPKYYPYRAGLNFVEQTKIVAVLWYSDSTVKMYQKEKKISDTAWLGT